MSINRDPSSLPELPLEMIERAKEQNATVIAVALDNNERIAQFFTVSQMRLNVGDHIKSEDGIWFKVENVAFTVASTDDGSFLHPSVYARPLKNQQNR